MAETRRGHRIRARLTAALPAPPAHLQKQLTVSAGENGNVTIETSNELSSLLGWLATLPLAEVHIEPLGLKTVYEKYHPAGDTA
jgi:ABC-2 type transport system ATP-binding protein